MSRKVAILGRAASVALAPFDDPEWEIWSMPWIEAKRVDRSFDVHSEQAWAEAGYPFGKGWESDVDFPVWCDASRMHLFKNAIEYPFDEVMRSLPIPFLECSISYEIALAMYEGVSTIGLWGVHMMGRNEYAFERPSVTYMVGLAQGSGIDVVIPESATLFQSNWLAGRYGVDSKKRYNLRPGMPDAKTPSKETVNV